MNLLFKQSTFEWQIGMLEALQDIEIASKFLGGSKGEEEDDEDPLDTQYKKLQCHISPLPHDSADFELVEKYLKRTHAPTHTVCFSRMPCQVCVVYLDSS